VGLLTHTKRGNLAILGLLDGISKILSLFLVCRMLSSVMCGKLERTFSSHIQHAQVRSVQQHKSTSIGTLQAFVFDEESPKL
jgi:hypothetical protein